VNIQRALTVVAAVLFVGSVGLATAGTEMASLRDAVGWISPRGVEVFHSWLNRVAGAWFWTWIAEPLLARPAWLPFGSLCLICAGAAFSFPAGGGGSTRQSQRRS
jgi:hypothetical protein